MEGFGSAEITAYTGAFCKVEIFLGERGWTASSPAVIGRFALQTVRANQSVPARSFGLCCLYKSICKNKIWKGCERFRVRAQLQP